MRPRSVPWRCSAVTTREAILVMVRLVGSIRLSMAQAGPPRQPGDGRSPDHGRLGRGEAAAWALALVMKAGPYRTAPALTSQAQTHTPICLLSSQEFRRRCDRPVILSSAKRHPSRGRSRTQPRVSPAQPRNTTCDEMTPGPLMAGAREAGYRWFTLALIAVADLARRTAKTSGAIAAGRASRATKPAAGRLAPLTAETC